MTKSRKWTNKIVDLENKSVDLENKSFEFNAKFESFMMNYQIQNRTISGVKDRIDEIEETLEKFEGEKGKGKNAFSGGNTSKPNDLENSQQISTIVDRLDGNDKLIDSLISKVQKINSKFNNKVKTPQFSESSEISQSKIGNKIKNLEKEIEDLRCSIPINTAASNDGTTHSSINQNLKIKLDHFRQDLDQTKSTVLSLQQMVEEKPDYDQLQEIDKVVTDKLNDCIKAVRRQMFEKSESTRSLKKLEKQLRSLYEVLYAQVRVSESEEDPIAEFKSKGHLSKYPMWKKPPTTKKIRMRSHNKDGTNMMSSTGDIKTFKYYNMEPIHGQSDF
mmetsp:Transcript_20952/g.20687  ORF Transcript_20952/g.20687 Transcript_20952/m.20687 type:complete len:332 (-) Transcript_20952:29-1024(-)